MCVCAHVCRSQVKLNKTGYPAPEAVGEPVMVGEGTFGGEFSDLTELQKIMVRAGGERGR